jgi:VanZ family protein
MRIVRVLICAGYWVLLTVLLLVPNPAAVIGLRKAPALPWGDFGVHFTAFVTLAIMIHAARWPRISGRFIIGLLLLYGIATELLQALIPLRAMEMEDCVEDILGILVGTGLYRLVQAAIRSRCRAQQCTTQLTSQGALPEPGVAGSTASSQV